MKKSQNQTNSVLQDWFDPIVEEVRQARRELSLEYEKDPEAFYARAIKHAKQFGFKISSLKPAMKVNHGSIPALKKKNSGKP